MAEEQQAALHSECARRRADVRMFHWDKIMCAAVQTTVYIIAMYV